MENRYFKYRQKFNIKHTIGSDAPHIHTVEVNLYFHEIDGNFKEFDSTQYALDTFFERSYDGKLMNDLPAFKEKMPTIENIGWEIYNVIAANASEIGYKLVKLEIGENPSRLYVVSDFLISGQLAEDSVGDEIRIKRYIDENYDEFVRIQEVRAKEKILKEKEEREKPPVVEEIKTEVPVQEEPDELKEALIAASIAIDETDELPSRRSIVHSRFYVLAAIALCVLFYFCAKSFEILTNTGDVYLHLGKSQYLLTELLKGRLSPIYMESWYDGYLMFMHCEPLAYYLMAFCGWLFGDSVSSGYILFLALTMFLGMYGFIRLGKIYNRPFAGFGAGFIWFFIPEMTRNYFITGDAKIILAVSFMPLLYSYISEYFKESRKRTLTKMAVTVALIVVSDLSVAMVVIIGMLFMFAFRCIKYEKYTQYIKVFLMLIVGVGLSMAWIYSAYANGSIPDFIINKEGFQGGIGVMLMLALCMLLGKHNIRYISIVGILAGIVSIYFVPQVVFISYLALFSVIVQWKGSKRIFAVSMLLVMAISCLYNFEYNRNYRNTVQYEQQTIIDKNIKEAVELAEEYTVSNLLYLDINNDSTYPAYYMTYNDKKIVFSNRSSAKYNMISDNIAQLKYALYTKHFDYLFDRGLEMSCDTFLVFIEGLNYKEADKEAIVSTASKYQYKTVEINDIYAIFHRDLPANYGVNVDYRGLAVGEKSDNVAIRYPYFQEASKENLMDYTFEELVEYDKIYVTDLQYEFLEDAENLVKDLADAGVDVYIDMDSIQSNPLTNRQVFLGCTAQSVIFKESYPKLHINDNIVISKEFYGDYTQWNTVYIENLDNVIGKTTLVEKELAFYGTVYNEHVHMISFNLLYHSIETQDESIGEMFDEILDLEGGSCPTRKIINIYSKFDGKSIIIESEEEAVLGIAYQKNFEGDDSIEKVNSLVRVDKGRTVINFNYNSLAIGVCITIMVVSIVVIINMLLTKQQKRR